MAKRDEIRDLQETIAAYVRRMQNVKDLIESNRLVDAIEAIDREANVVFDKYGYSTCLDWLNRSEHRQAGIEA